MKLSRVPLLFAVSLLAVGCAVGPDFTPPAAPNTDHYTSDTFAMPKGSAQHVTSGEVIRAQWWKAFHSPSLDALVAEALKNNPTLESAQAALRVARENASAQGGAYFPSVSAQFTPSRAKTSNELSPVPNAKTFIYSLYTAQVNVAYAPDIFGLNRRTVESLDALADSQRFQLEATRLTLSANVVATAIQEASLRAQLKATERSVTVGAELLGLLNRQESLGQISGLDVLVQESALAQAQQLLPPLQKQLAQTRTQLAALAGHVPSDESAETLTLADLHLPESLPLSLPSQLVEQRPDIRAAEENLHAASAQVGIAIANRLPNIILSANSGSSSLAFSDLFTSGTGFWTIAGGITQPILDGGALRHKERAARAALDQAKAEYRNTVIAAFQNVADTLHALKYDADALAAATHSETAAKRSLALMRKQVSLGLSPYFSLLAAEQTYQTAMVTRAQAEASRYADTAALFQALGGGWWNRKHVEDASHSQ